MERGAELGGGRGGGTGGVCDGFGEDLEGSGTERVGCDGAGSGAGRRHPRQLVDCHPLPFLLTRPFLFVRLSPTDRSYSDAVPRLPNCMVQNNARHRSSEKSDFPDVGISNVSIGFNRPRFRESNFHMD